MTQHALASGYGPPDLPPGELLTALTTQPRPYKIVPFPRRDPMTKEAIGDIAIWPCIQRELMEARAAADAYAKRLFRKDDKPREGETNLGYEGIFKDALTVELLVRACRQPKDLKSAAFPTAQIFRDHVTANEAAVLTRLYLQIERDVGPLVDLMTNEEMDAWIKRLQEDGTRHPLAFLSTEQMEDLLMYSVSRPATSPTGSTSSGSPQGDGSTDSEADGPPAVDVAEPPPADLSVQPPFVE